MTEDNCCFLTFQHEENISVSYHVMQHRAKIYIRKDSIKLKIYLKFISQTINKVNHVSRCILCSAVQSIALGWDLGYKWKYDEKDVVLMCIVLTWTSQIDSTLAKICTNSVKTSFAKGPIGNKP